MERFSEWWRKLKIAFGIVLAGLGLVWLIVRRGAVRKEEEREITQRSEQDLARVRDAAKKGDLAVLDDEWKR